MKKFDTKKYAIYARFLNKLAKDLTSFYYSKLNKTFKVSNKLKGKGYDPVTTSDRAFEKFIRYQIKKKFPNHQIIGEEYGIKKTKSDFSWIIDPIDGTRSFVIGSPTWSNLISLNHNGSPVLGLANFPVLRKYYINFSNTNAYVVQNGKRKKLLVNKNAKFKSVRLSASFQGILSLDKQKKIPKILNLMEFPSSDALSYAQLAEGTVDVVIQRSSKIWDIHPLIPIIHASGGIVSTWDNRNAINAGHILVSSNKTLHEKFLKLLKPVI